MTHFRLRAGLTLLFALAALGRVATPLAVAASPPSPSVIGGTPVAQGGFPYAAYIYATTTDTAFQACTGTVIAPTIILTAAHCVFFGGALLSPGVFSVQTGSVTRSMTTPPVPPNVVAVRPDPYYNPATFQNDAAILVLNAPTSAPAVPLATTASTALYAPGTVVSYAGWGETIADDASSAAPQLQTGTVSILPNATCQSAVEFHPGVTLCVGGAGYRPATCHGDSGGPLIANTATGAVQIGIVSYSATSCGIAPDYFTRVAAVQSWVASAIAGTAAPPAYIPPFNAPAAPSATLAADGVAVSFTAPAVDPATLATAFAVTLVGANGAAVATQTLAATATTASFPSIQPGTYTVSLVAAYSEGSSAAALSAPVTLKPPRYKTRPKLAGAEVVGYRLGCKNGTWSWPGSASFTVAWLRNGKPIAGQKSTIYPVKQADVGTRLICQITLHATTGSTAKAESTSVLAGVRLKLAKKPKLVGPVAVGSPLVCTTGSWVHTGPLAITVQWLRSSTVIKGATRSRRVLVNADAGHQIACKVTVTATGQSAWYRTASRLVR
jgi:secreted trypsin-like serine protease